MINKVMKILLGAALLSSVVFAERIPDRGDRNIKRICQSLIADENKIPNEELDLLSFLFGAIDMAMVAHMVNGEKVVNKSKRTDIAIYSCKKAMKEKELVKEAGFKGVLFLEIYKATLKE